jgi:ABC-type sugar transport system permease subunit
MKLWRKQLSLEQKKAWTGVLFTSPLIIGLIMLFVLPLIQSLRYSLSSIELVEGGFTVKYKGIENFVSLFTTNPDFPRKLTESIVDMVVNVPIILIFSLFVAVLLNQKFRGRAFARAVFFLPVILMSSAAASVSISYFVGGMSMGDTGASGAGQESLMKSFELKKMLLDSGIAPIFVNYLTGAVDRIYDIISSSGVQILIFLAGLQSVSPSLYEASKIEGATGYEIFWKVTFPIMTPLMLTNLVYSIIDSFSTSKLNELIRSAAFELFDFGLSSAMSWVFFMVVAIVLAGSAGLISRKVFYYD